MWTYQWLAGNLTAVRQVITENSKQIHQIAISLLAAHYQLHSWSMFHSEVLFLGQESPFRTRLLVVENLPTPLSVTADSSLITHTCLTLYKSLLISTAETLAKPFKGSSSKKIHSHNIKQLHAFWLPHTWWSSLGTWRLFIFRWVLTLTLLILHVMDSHRRSQC